MGALEDLTRRCWSVAREVATVAKDIRLQLSRRNESVPEISLRAELAVQCKFREKIGKLRSETFEEHQITDDMLTEGREVIERHEQRVDSMFNEALGGNMPELPGLV